MFVPSFYWVLYLFIDCLYIVPSYTFVYVQYTYHMCTIFTLLFSLFYNYNTSPKNRSVHKSQKKNMFFRRTSGRAAAAKRSSKLTTPLTTPAK